MKRSVFAIFVLFASSCANEDPKPRILPEDTDFFPVNSFLQGQVHEVDSLKLPTRRYNSKNGKSDSVLISLAAFDSLATEFIESDINDPLIKKFFKETSFADQSIPSVTFTYSTRNNELPLRRVDVIVNPDPVVNDQVNSVYIEKVTKSGDTTILKKMYWKTNRYFRIISTKKVNDSPAILSEIKVAWSAAD